jgi:hypothetical protein
MPEISLKLACPKCGLSVKASLGDNCSEFILFVCPKCQSNVVYYDHKIDVISNKLLSKLIRNKRLKMCGVLKANTSLRNNQPINFDDIVNLRIVLETSLGVDDFLSKI